MHRKKSALQISKFDAMVDALADGKQPHKAPAAAAAFANGHAATTTGQQKGPSFIFVTPTTPRPGQTVLVPWRFRRSGDDDVYDSSVTTIDLQMTIPPPCPSDKDTAALPKIEKIIHRIMQACVLTPEEHLWVRRLCSLIAPTVSADLIAIAATADPYAEYQRGCRRRYFTVVQDVARAPDILLLDSETLQSTSLLLRTGGCLVAVITNGSLFQSTHTGRAYCGRTRSAVYEAVYARAVEETVCEPARNGGEPCDVEATVVGRGHRHVPGVCPVTVDLAYANNDLMLAIRLSEVERVLALFGTGILLDETLYGPDGNLVAFLRTFCFRVWRQSLADQFHYGIAGSWIGPVQSIGPELMNRLDLCRDLGAAAAAAATEDMVTEMLASAALTIHRICVLCNRACCDLVGIPSHCSSSAIAAAAADSSFVPAPETPRWLVRLLQWVTRLCIPATAATPAAAAAAVANLFSVDSAKPAEAWRTIILLAATAVVETATTAPPPPKRVNRGIGNAWPAKRNCCSISSAVLSSCGKGTHAAVAGNSYTVGLLLSRLPCCCLWACRPLYREFASQLLLDSTERPAAAAAAAASAETTGVLAMSPNAVVNDLLVTVALGADAGVWIGPRGCPVPVQPAHGLPELIPRSSVCRPYTASGAGDSGYPLMYLPSKRELWGLGGVRERTLFITRSDSEKDVFAAIQACSSLPIGARNRVLLRSISCPAVTAAAAAAAAAATSTDASAVLEAMPCLSMIAADVGALIAIEMTAKSHTPRVILELALGAHSVSELNSRIVKLTIPLIYVVVCPRQKDVDRMRDKWKPYTTAATAVTNASFQLTPAWICVLLLHPLAVK